MASRKYLNMSFGYVPQWSYVDAIRELFQNALDAERANPEHKMYFGYDSENQTLCIGNENSGLDLSTLLLGSSSKREDTNQIGEHGEGYKVATVVLLREGLGLKVYNAKKKQIWTAKAVKSRSYKETIPVFDVEQQIFKHYADLIFEVTGVSQEMFAKIVESNLWLYEEYKEPLGEVKKTEYGRILLDKKFSGKIFVKGLYVCDNSNITYGYDFAPSLVKLDRDRKLVDSFDIMWNASKLIASSGDSDFIEGCIDLNDGKYLSSFNYVLSSDVNDSVATKFYADYGTTAVPVYTNESFNESVKLGYHPIMVSATRASLIRSSVVYEQHETKVPTLGEQLSAWFDEIKPNLDENLASHGEELISSVLAQLS